MAFHTVCAYVKLERRLYERIIGGCARVGSVPLYSAQTPAPAVSRTASVAADSRVHGCTRPPPGCFLERIYDNFASLRDSMFILFCAYGK